MREPEQKLYVVGLGPGGLEHMTEAALAAIARSGAVVGYAPYIRWIESLLAGKKVFSSGMRREIDRGKEALALYAAGNTVSVVSSGDAGIYGMAGLVLELAAQEGLCAQVEVVPGVSALNAAAALLGAPLTHDFCAISLSDLLTDWSTIEKRLHAAAGCGFVIGLYNPRSAGRPNNIVRAAQILLEYLEPDTPVGIVRHACREGQTVLKAALGALPFESIDMNTMVIVGNAQTRWLEGRMVTPRGYAL